jgi:hypothetical protein
MIYIYATKDLTREGSQICAGALMIIMHSRRGAYR